jgi:hypothetical protein
MSGHDIDDVSGLSYNGDMIIDVNDGLFINDASPELWLNTSSTSGYIYFPRTVGGYQRWMRMRSVGAYLYIEGSDDAGSSWEEVARFQGNNQDVYFASQIFAGGSATIEGTLTLDSTFNPDIIQKIHKPSGGFATDMFQIYTENTASEIEQLMGKIGMYGTAGASHPSPYYFFIGAGNTTAYNNADFKFSKDGYFGVNISGSSFPSYPIDVRASTGGISANFTGNIQANLCNSTIGLTGNYSTGECWMYYQGGVLTDTNCTSL